MARSSNITLSSIADLEENSEDERIEIELVQLRKRLSRLRDSIRALTLYEKLSKVDDEIHRSIIHAVPGVDMSKVMPLFGQASMIESALSAAEAGHYPFPYISRGTRLVAHTGSELATKLCEELTDLENGITELEAAAHEARERLS